MEVPPLRERLARARAQFADTTVAESSGASPRATPAPSDGSIEDRLSRAREATGGGLPPSPLAKQLDIPKVGGGGGNARVGDAVYEAQRRGDITGDDYAGLAADSTGTRAVDRAFSQWGQSQVDFGAGSPEEMAARASYLGVRNTTAPTAAGLDARLDPSGMPRRTPEDTPRQGPSHILSALGVPASRQSLADGEFGNTQVGGYRVPVDRQNLFPAQAPPPRTVGPMSRVEDAPMSARMDRALAESVQDPEAVQRRFRQEMAASDTMAPDATDANRLQRDRTYRAAEALDNLEGQIDATELEDRRFWAAMPDAEPVAVTVDLEALLSSPDAQAAEYGRIPQDRPVALSIRMPDGTVVPATDVTSPAVATQALRRAADQTRRGGLFREAVVGAERGLLGMGEALNELVGLGGDLVGAEDFAARVRDDADRVGALSAGDAYRASEDATLEADPLRFVAATGGEALPQMALAGVGGGLAAAAGKAAPLGMYLVNYPLMFGQQLGDAATDPTTGERRDYTGRDVAAAAVSAAASAAVESLAESNLFSRAATRLGFRSGGAALRAEAQRGLRTVLQRAVDAGYDISKSGVVEAATEGLQQGIENAGAMSWDDERSLIDGVLEAMFAGGALGVGIQGGATTIGATVDSARRTADAGRSADALAAYREAFDRLQQAEPDAVALAQRFRDEVLAPSVERNPALAEIANRALAEAVEADRAFATQQGLSPREARRAGVAETSGADGLDYDQRAAEAFARFQRQNPNMEPGDAAQEFAAAWLAENPDPRTFDPNVTGAGAPDLRSGPLPIPRWQVEQTLPAETAPERPRSEVLRDDVRARAERFAARAPEEAPDASALPQTAPTAAPAPAPAPAAPAAPATPPAPTLTAQEQADVETARALADDPDSPITPEQAARIGEEIVARARGREDAVRAREADRIKRQKQAESERLLALLDEPLIPTIPPLADAVSTTEAPAAAPVAPAPVATATQPDPAPVAAQPAPDATPTPVAPAPTAAPVATAGPSASAPVPPAAESAIPPAAESAPGPRRTFQRGQRGQRGSVIVTFESQEQADLYDLGSLSSLRSRSMNPSRSEVARKAERRNALIERLTPTYGDGVLEAARREYDHVREQANAAPDPDDTQPEVTLTRAPQAAPQATVIPPVADDPNVPVSSAPDVAPPPAPPMPPPVPTEASAEAFGEPGTQNPRPADATTETPSASAQTPPSDAPAGQLALDGTDNTADPRIPVQPFTDGEGDPFVHREGTDLNEPNRPTPEPDTRFLGKGLTLGDVEAEVGPEATARTVVELGFPSTRALVNSVNVEVTRQSASLSNPALQVEAAQRTSRGGFPSPAEGVPVTPEGRWIDWRTLPYDDVVSYSSRRYAVAPDKVTTARREAAENRQRPVLTAPLQLPDATQATATPETASTPRTAPATAPRADAPTSETRQGEAAPSTASSRRVHMVPIEDLAVDTDRFQPRDAAYSEESVDRITARFDPRELDPLRTWTDPSDGREYVLAGHSRHEAIRRLQADGTLPEGYEVPVDPFEGTEAEAIEFAARENASRTAQTPAESAEALRAAMQGQSRTARREEARVRHGREGALVADLASLNPTGPTLATLRTFPPGTEGYRTAQAMAQMVGRARDRFPMLTDAHEAELWRYVQERYGRGNARTLADFTAFLNDVVERRTVLGEGGEAVFEADRPLGLQALPPRADAQIDAQIAEADKALKDAQRERAAAEKQYAPWAVGQQLADVLAPFDEAVRAAQREAVRVREEAGRARTEVRRQQSLFGGDDRLAVVEGAEADGLTDEQAQAIEAFAGDVSESLGPVSVVQTISELPDGVRERAESARSDQTALPAAFTPDGAYVVLDEVARAAAAHGVTPLEAARSAIAHEVLAHQGIREALGEAGEADLLDAVWKAVGRARIEEAGLLNRYWGQLERTNGVLTENDKRLLAAEHLGALAGRSGALDKGVWTKVRNALRRAWTRMFGRGSVATDAELDALLRGVRDFLEARRDEGAPPATEAFSAVALRDPAIRDLTTATMDEAETARWRQAEAEAVDGDHFEMILRGLDGQPLSDGERAALTVRLRDVLRERSESLARAVGFVEAGDRGSARRAGLRALGLAEEAGRLVRAIEGGGANDPGSVRRLDLGGAALDLDTLVREVEVVRGERLTPDQTKGLREALGNAEQAADRVRVLEDQTQSAEEARAQRVVEQAAERQRAAEARAQRSTKAAETFAERAEAARAERAAILDQMGRLGLRMNDVTGVAAEGANLLRKLAQSYLREKAYSLAEVIARVQADAPWATRADILRAIAGPMGKPDKVERRARLELARAYAERTRQRAAVRAAQAALKPKTIGSIADSVINLPRSLMASGDLSAVGNQAAPLVRRHPILAARALFTSLANLRTADAETVNAAIRLSPNHYLREIAGLYLSPVGAEADVAALSQREETFRSRLVERTSWLWRAGIGAGVGTVAFGPGVGTAAGAAYGVASKAVVTLSENQYGVFLNTLRAAAFDAWAEANGGATVEDLRAVARVINLATGRGELGRAEALSAPLATVLFSPRLTAARFQLPWAVLRTSSSRTERAYAAQVLGSFVGLNLLFLAALDLGTDDDEWQVGWDPRSSDFGRIVGGPGDRLRIDIWGGYAANARLLARALLGASDAAGLTDRPKGLREIDPADEIGRYANSKKAPWLGLLFTAMTGKDFKGDPTTLARTVREGSLPITVNETLDALDTGGDTDGQRQGAAAYVALLNTLGINTSAYDDPTRATHRMEILSRAGYPFAPSGPAAGDYGLPEDLDPFEKLALKTAFRVRLSELLDAAGPQLAEMEDADALHETVKALAKDAREGVAGEQAIALWDARRQAEGTEGD